MTDNGGKPVEKRYAKIKLAVSLTGMALDLAFMALFAFSGISRPVYSAVALLVHNIYIQFLLFMMVLSTVMTAVGLPMDFYSSYLIEHRFGLSNQSIWRWFWEKTKSAAVGTAIALPLSLAFFFFLQVTGEFWWLWFGLLAVTVAVVMARIAPAFIYPLFYKFKKLEEGDITGRIERLLADQKVRFQGIYSFNMSRDTKKANAGFAGIGKGRRIMLSDTLVGEFTPDEIAVVFAHELGHYRKRHLVKNLVVSSAIILSSFYLCGLAYRATLLSMGFGHLHEIAAIPILLCYLTVFGIIIMPLTNMLSRQFEREADRFALETTGDTEHFISSMEKLASLNLADMHPHPLVEFLFHSHPSIQKRIDFARNR